MEHRQWERVRAAFDEIVDLPEAAREARLARIGQIDPRTRGMVEALIRGNAIANAVTSTSTPERTVFEPTHDKPPADPPREVPEPRRLLDPTASAPAPAPIPAPSTTQRVTSRRVSITTASLLLSVLVIALAAFALRRDKAPTAPTWLDLDAPDSASARSFGLNPISLSPDGSAIAYVGGPSNSLFVRSLNDSRGPRKIERSDNARCPSFSPDGKWIVFTTNLHLVKIPASGGTPTSVIDSIVDQCALWIGNKQILFERNASLFTVSAEGLATRLDTLNDIRELHLSQTLPGDKQALVSFITSTHWELGVLSLTDGKLTRLGRNGVAPRYANGYLLYGDSAVFAAPFSLRGTRVTGPTTQLPLRSRQFTTSASDRMAYIDGAGQGDSLPSLVAVSTDGHTRTLLAASPGETPRLSPDSKRLSWDTWVYDLETQRLTKLADQSSGLRPMGWTLDSRRIVFLAPDSGTVVRQVWDGTAPPHELIRLPVPATTFTMGPRHGYAAFSVYDARTRSPRGDIWIVPLDTPSAARPFIATKAHAAEPRMSYDGDLLAYTSNESGRNEVYVRPLAGTAPAIQVSDSGGSQPVWSIDDDYLYYRGPSQMMRATLARGATLTIKRREGLFQDIYEQADGTNYDVIPGDKELLMLRRNPTGQHIGIVMDWPILLSQHEQRL